MGLWHDGKQRGGVALGQVAGAEADNYGMNFTLIHGELRVEMQIAELSA